MRDLPRTSDCARPFPAGGILTASNFLNPVSGGHSSASRSKGVECRQFEGAAAFSSDATSVLAAAHDSTSTRVGAAEGAFSATPAHIAGRNADSTAVDPEVTIAAAGIPTTGAAASVPVAACDQLNTWSSHAANGFDAGEPPSAQEPGVRSTPTAEARLAVSVAPYVPSALAAHEAPTLTASPVPSASAGPRCTSQTDHATSTLRPVGSARSPAEYSVRTIMEDYGGGGGSTGYLDLKESDIVYVLYEGEEGAEAGWCYGWAKGHAGWFPAFLALSVPAQAG